jgi:hypothetical protein
LIESCTIKEFIFAGADVALPHRGAGTGKQACSSGGRQLEKNVYDTVSRQTETDSPGFPVATGSAPVATGDVPIATGDIPVRIGNIPVAIRDTPVRIGDIPIAIGDAPVRIGNAPVATGMLPVATGNGRGKRMRQGSNIPM